jgi:cytoskeletal protein CcmA (bactofilin family)
MFTRRDSQTPKPTTDTRTQPEPSAPVTPQPEPVVAPPVAEASQPQVVATSPAAPAENVSVIAAGDVFEGKLTTTNGVRVQGTVRGTIESKSNIQVDENASVEADLTAENVTIAGSYKGSLNCNGRLEITASGRASGELETGRILLHEGGFFEGTLHMKPEQATATTQTDPARRRYSGGKD